MSIGGGPVIVQRGLSLSLDTANRVSYPGEPTTNLVSNPHNPQGNWGSRSGATFIDNNRLPGDHSGVPKGCVGYKMDANSSASTWSGNSYSYSNVGSESVTVGEKMTFSCWMYVSSDFNGNWARLSAESSGTGATYYNLSNKGTWQRVTHKYTAISTGSAAHYLYWSKSGGTTWALAGLTGYVIYCAPQVERKAHATQFSNITRATSEALRDLSGNGNHAGLSNSKFDSSADIRFNENTIGNAATVDSDFCDITISEGFDLGHIAFWMKPDLMHTKSYLGYYPTLFSWGSRGTISAGPWTGGATDEVFHIWDNNGSMTYTRTNIPAEWNYVVWNWNGSAYDCYINNEQVTTYTATNGDGGGANMIDVGTGTRIGNNFSTYSWRGYMPVVQMYNRGLSETEMTQNFNALRARYGI